MRSRVCRLLESALPMNSCRRRSHEHKCPFNPGQAWAWLCKQFLPPLTARIFAKIGVENINSDLATFVCMLVVVCAPGLIVYANPGHFQDRKTLRSRTCIFFLVVCQGSARGRSGLCLFSRALRLGNAAQTAPIRQTKLFWSPYSSVFFWARAFAETGVLPAAAGAILVAVPYLSEALWICR